VGLRSEPLNLDEYMPDWPKRTLDITLPDGKIVENVEELRRALEANGTSVEEFRTLPAYNLALESRRYPWLASL
jgi:hypothetical protein